MSMSLIIQHTLLAIALLEVALHSVTEVAFIFSRGRSRLTNLDIFLLNTQFIFWVGLTLILIKV